MFKIGQYTNNNTRYCNSHWDQTTHLILIDSLSRVLTAVIIDNKFEQVIKKN